MIGKVGTAAEAASAEAARVIDTISDDPVAFLIHVLRVIGTALLVVAGICGVVGYYLRGEATRSKAEAAAQLYQIGQAWGKVGAQFSNLSAIPNPLANSNASVTGGNVLTDVVNFGTDTLNAAEGVVGALGTGIEDLGKALADIPPALWASAQAMGTSVLTLPGLIWNEAVWAGGGTIANVLLWLFPYAAIAGAALWGASIGLWLARDSWQHAAKPAYDQARADWGERQREKVWQPFFDRLYGNRRKAAPPAHPAPAAPPPVASVAAPAPSEAQSPNSASQSEPSRDKAHVEPEAEGGPSLPGDPTGVEREDNQGPASPPAPPDGPEEFEGPAPTERTEDLLGEYPSARERMRVLMREKRGDPPEPDPASSEDLRIEILQQPLEA